MRSLVLHVVLACSAQAAPQEEAVALDRFEERMSGPEARKKHGLDGDAAQAALAQRTLDVVTSAAGKIRFLRFVAGKSLKACAPAVAKLLRDRGETVPTPDTFESPERVGHIAAAVLAGLGRENAPEFARLLKEDDPGLRRMATWYLAQLKATEFANEIAPLLKDPDAGVRLGAIAAVGTLGAKAHIGDIAAFLKDADGWTRTITLRALGDLEAKDQAGKIAELLKDADGRARGSAAETLGRLGAKDSTAKIAELLKDPETSVRVDAMQALAVLDAKDRAGEIGPLLKSGSFWQKANAALALAALGSVQHAREIAELLTSDESAAGTDAGPRGCAAASLAHLGQSDHIEAIAKLLDEERPNEKGMAVWALGRLGARRYADRIAPLIGRTDSCWVYDPAAKRGSWTTLGEVAGRVLRDWGDPRAPK